MESHQTAKRTPPLSMSQELEDEIIRMVREILND